MRKTLYLMLLLLSAGAVQINAQEAGQELKVMTFNILHGATMKGDFDLDLLANIILEQQPDVVALQEVDYKTGRAKDMDLVTELALRTKMAGLFGAAMPFDGGYYGVGVLSKYPFVNTANHALPYTKGNEPRTALEVAVQLDNGSTLKFIATHLDHKSEGVDRMAQAQYINSHLVKEDEVCLLLGDLNATPGSPAINLLEEQWTGSYDKKAAAGTYPSSGAEKKIDYVMYHPAKAWEVKRREVICDTLATDHCIYVADLKFLGIKE